MIYSLRQSHSLAHHEVQRIYADQPQADYWLNDDLQFFTPTRFMPPKLMGYQGRAVVMGLDIFATTDIWELLSRDMGGKAIMCRMRSGPKRVW